MNKTLVYDSDCGFCTVSAQWLAKNDRVNIKAWQVITNLDKFGLTEEMVTTAAYWIDGDDPVAHGDAAIAKALIQRGKPWRFAGQFILLPFIKPIAATIYKIIARNRHAMPGGTNACRLPR
ncbi:thiol-disulfide oxidoreductase DCC family protein [Kocuria rosea]|uniref:thiol-disulfide oxidoreductase DCC family protein n=1 Tax=Kocuria rosea TaxID=1275 RepID=UPI001364D3DE|nr:DCC1-like thiol-disulfide oxidoreductase family protein [Kocuria polaris]